MWLIKKMVFVLILHIFFKVVVYPYIESYMDVVCMYSGVYLLVSRILKRKCLQIEPLGELK